jgi:hypothetical protein
MLKRGTVARLLLGVACALGAAPAVSAQSGQITAQAGVGPQVSVTGQQNLTFGAGLFPGVSRAVSPRTGATAARFYITGTANDEVNITINAPSLLAGPGPGLPMDTWRYCHGSTATQANCTEAAFTTLPLVRLLSAGGELYVWLGATARPTASQPAGTYTGNVELIAAYTGN